MTKMPTEVMKAILEGREKRALLQKELLQFWGTPLVSFTLNIPGPEKNSPNYKLIHEIGVSLLLNALAKAEIEVVYFEIKERASGTEGFFCIKGDSLTIKKTTVLIEEGHYLGRIFDFDVLNKEGRAISRRDIGLNERKCFLCESPANFCRRNHTHTLDELLKGLNQLIEDFICPKEEKNEFR
ncbi:citrate lyase holo-[acyl-carrier protein] synthase [Alkaliphilus transvaalensis]|uniref:citrate lyase holo-[acyl-carrier protein] synthase n=1 Tax=Alkaliphilus transvaalensis TaxID=114628 RepID=UPI0005555A28|nr:citrate lyase holo-[acyl-carrier protein] synthase [Alkaliphilus transvaalensis]